MITTGFLLTVGVVLALFVMNYVIWAAWLLILVTAWLALTAADICWSVLKRLWALLAPFLQP